jgi:hypothetical protein
MPVTSPTGETLAQVQARHAAEIEAHLAARPGDFVKNHDLSDDEIADKVEAFTRKHLKRFPKTDCALALSIKSLYEGNSTSYQR